MENTKGKDSYFILLSKYHKDKNSFLTSSYIFADNNLVLSKIIILAFYLNDSKIGLSIAHNNICTSDETFVVKKLTIFS